MNDFQVAYRDEKLETGAPPPVWDAFCGLIGLVQCGASKIDIRNQITALEAEMMKLPQVEQPLEHFFTDGLYGRKIFNPKDSFIITKIHKEPNFSFILSGRLAVITEDGMEIHEGPKFFVTKPGTKRLIYAQTDVVFMTVHPNPENLRSLDVLEDRIIAKDFDEVPFELKEVLS